MFLFFPGVSFILFILVVGAICAFCTALSSTAFMTARFSESLPHFFSSLLGVTDAGILMLNWGPELADSDSKILGEEINDYRFTKEKWYFINGVMVGTFWLESAINEISRLFERRVIGIRNLTFVPSCSLPQSPAVSQEIPETVSEKVLMTDGVSYSI